MSLSIRHSLFSILYSLFSIHYSLFTVLYSLFPVHCSLFTVPYSLFPKNKKPAGGRLLATRYAMRRYEKAHSFRVGLCWRYLFFRLEASIVLPLSNMPVACCRQSDTGVQKSPLFRVGLCWRYLFSRPVARQVSSPQVSLTSVFGMGTGGPSPQSTPTVWVHRTVWAMYPEN